MHVSGEPEQFGLPGVRFAAIDDGESVYEFPSTLASVMTIDFVAVEIYCLCRAIADVPEGAFGTTIVKRALPFACAGADVATGTGCAELRAIGLGPPPAEQLDTAKMAAKAKSRRYTSNMFYLFR